LADQPVSDHLAITPGPPLSVFDAAAQVVAEQTHELKRQARKVRHDRDDVEAVHQMRVATRRLRTALRALRGHIAPPTRLKKRLGWLADALGEVRDHDVILALLRSERLRGASREERERLAALIERLERKRGKAQDRLRAVLKRPRYKRLLADLAMFADQPGGTGDHHLAARVLAGVSETLGTLVAKSPAMTASEPDADALHMLRIQFKRLRYALDFHAAASGLAYDVERRMARALQDVLGELHDRDLLLGWLARGRGAFAGPWPRLEARLGAERARLMRRFLRLRRQWAERTRPEPALASLEPPRFAHLDVQPVTLRLVTGPKQVASGMIR